MLERLAKLRLGPWLVAAGTATVAIAAVVLLTGVTGGRGTGDPTELECGGEAYVALGINETTNDSYRATPELGAAAYAAAITPDGEPVPSDAVLVDVTSEEQILEGFAQGDRTFAVRVDGRTVALLGLEQQSGRWAVGSDAVC